nr:hypothetical protein [Tanacetum cinerariifolium]
MMLDSIVNSPLVYPTVEENGQTRLKKYSELTKAQQIQDDYSGLAVPTFQQGEDPIDCINKTMAFISVVVSRFRPLNNQLKMFTNPRYQATIQDGRVTVQQLQGRQTQSFAGTGNRGVATTSRGNYAVGQAKEKLMLAEAQEAAFQTKDLDAYDSDCDDISLAKAVLMENVLSCDLDVLYEDTNSTTPSDLLVLSLVRKIKCVIAKEHDVISVNDDEETLILEEEKQAFWLKHSNYNPDISVKSHTSVRIEAPSELSKISLVNESLKKLKYQLASFDKVVNKRTTSDDITADSGLVVPTFQQGEDSIDCINKAMAFISVMVSRFSPLNNQLRMFTNPRYQATIQDGRVTVQQLQGRQTQSFAGTGIRGVATTSRGNYAVGQAKVVKCYNCLRKENMAKECTQPKRPRSSAWFKEKLMLAEAQEAAFQTKDLDAYDSDCDDISLAKAVLMENLSRCDSDVLYEDTNSTTPSDLLVLSLVKQMTDHVANLDKENQKNKMVNESLTAELERYKERVAIFEQRLNVYLNKRENFIDSQMDDLIRNRNAKFAAFQQEIDTLKETLSNQVKEKESLSTTLTVFKTQCKKKESKYIDKEIVLENQNKELENTLWFESVGEYPVTGILWLGVVDGLDGRNAYIKDGDSVLQYPNVKKEELRARAKGIRTLGRIFQSIYGIISPSSALS